MHTLPDISEISKLLFESAAEGLLISDKKGEIQLVNPRACEMFGYSSEELHGQRIEMLMASNVRDKHQNLVRGYAEKPLRRAMGQGLDLYGRRKDGSMIPIEISLNHFTANEDQYFMALISDISERKKAEAALVKLNEELEERVDQRTRELRESEHLYSMMARSFPNGTMNVFDRSYNYIFAEGKEMYKLGITSDKLVGTNYLNRIPEELRQEIRNNLDRAFEGEQVNFEVLHGDSYYLMSAIGLPAEQGSPERILVIEQNITPQKQAERDMREALEKEKELNELKSRFVSMASHEFRTPLSTVLSSATLIERYNETLGHDRVEKHISKIKSSVHHLTGILNDFLSLDKLEQGKISAQMEEFNLREMCDDLVDDMLNLSPEERVINLSYSGSDVVCLDQNIMKNILTNLMSNALKYSPAHQPVDLEVVNENGQLTLGVTDRGMGIPEAEQKHLFERFFRAKNASNIEGTGLGLNIVNRYVTMLNGSLSYQSEEGKGTNFTIKFNTEAS